MSVLSSTSPWFRRPRITWKPWEKNTELYGTLLQLGQVTTDDAGKTLQKFPIIFRCYQGSPVVSLVRCIFLCTELIHITFNKIIPCALNLSKSFYTSLHSWVLGSLQNGFLSLESRTWKDCVTSVTSVSPAPERRARTVSFTSGSFPLVWKTPLIYIPFSQAA